MFRNGEFSIFKIEDFEWSICGNSLYWSQMTEETIMVKYKNTLNTKLL